MRVASESWRQDLFAELLGSIRLPTSAWLRLEVRAPWGFSIADGGTVFHVVTHGDCWLEVKRLATPLRLFAGDLGFLPRGDRYALKDAPGTRPVDFLDFVARHPPDRKRVVRAGGPGAMTKLVCGAMRFEDRATDPLLAVLPPLIHVAARDVDSTARMRLTVEHVIEELDSDRPGCESVITRLAEILFIEAVRVYLDENMNTAESGWLAALRDQQVGQALALLHAHPHEPWTVASLADRVALSRSSFAAKFAHLVGEPPLRYLTRLRLNTASARLRSGDAKLSAIAAAVGYESVAAFVKAFKRSVGVTPGEYRRARQPVRLPGHPAFTSHEPTGASTARQRR
jgi:AraC-like DNA-binding protein